MVARPRPQPNEAAWGKLSILLEAIVHDLVDLQRHAHHLRGDEATLSSAEILPRDLDSLILAANRGEKFLRQFHPHSGGELAQGSGSREPALGSTRKPRGPAVELIIACKRVTPRVERAYQLSRKAGVHACRGILLEMATEFEKQLWFFNSPVEAPSRKRPPAAIFPTPGFAI